MKDNIKKIAIVGMGSTAAIEQAKRMSNMKCFHPLYGSGLILNESKFDKK